MYSLSHYPQNIMPARWIVINTSLNTGLNDRSTTMVIIDHPPSRIKIKSQIHLVPGPIVIPNEGVFDMRPISIIGANHSDHVNRAFDGEGIRLANYDEVGEEN